MGEELRSKVKERYAGAALTVLEGTGSASCCGSAGERGLDSEALGVDWTGGGYSTEELETLPQAAGTASLGCGNPTALATLSPGELVLDLGSGGGIDVLLSAKRVTHGGKGNLPPELVSSIESWSGCVSGALEKDEYEGLLRGVGFEDVSVEVTHTYDEELAEAGLASGCCGGSGCCGDTTTATAGVELASAFIRGCKPAGKGTP